MLFHGKTSPYSNFFPALFTVKGVTYTCNEQYYQCKKAETFADDNTAQKILASTDPVEMMRLGKHVRGFNETVWHQQDIQTMTEANIAKYEQNHILAKFLKDTGHKQLAESSKYDLYWGTGKSLRNPTAFQDWAGLNKMGEVLTRVRSRLPDVD